MQTFIITISGRGITGTSYRVQGSIKQIKKHLIYLIKSDKKIIKENLNSATLTLNSLMRTSNGSICGIAIYYDSSIYYKATPDNEPILLDDNGKEYKEKDND